MADERRPIDLALRRIRYGLALLAAAGLSFGCGDSPADPEREEAPPASIAISTEHGDTLPLLIVGESEQWTAVARDSAGIVRSGYRFTWSTSDSSVAAVDSTGRVTGLRFGSATVYATAAGTTDAQRLHVWPLPPVAAVLTPSDTTLRVGERHQFHVRWLDAQGAETPVPWPVTWRSLNVSSIAVTYVGVVTAVEPSSEPARIVVSDGNAADTAIVRVENWPAQSARGGAR